VIRAAAPRPVQVKERMIDWGPIIHESYGMRIDGFLDASLGFANETQRYLLSLRADNVLAAPRSAQSICLATRARMELKARQS
jgi:hypothetical protein